MRVPTPNVSLCSKISILYKKKFIRRKDKFSISKFISKQKVKVLEISNEKLVSIDFNHNSASSIIDASLTKVVGKNMGKISAWYDNEWGFQTECVI